jgi:hypothetical protein
VPRRRLARCEAQPADQNLFPAIYDVADHCLFREIHPCAPA